jgi:hypothetical protein
VGPGPLLTRFGPWHAQTALDNIVDVAMTGPYMLVKTAGPAQLVAVRQRTDLCRQRGLRRVPDHAEPVRGIEPFGLLPHPNLTVTVADCDGLVDAVQAG